MSRKRRRSRMQLGLAGVIYAVVAGVILAVAIYTQANLLFWFFGLMVGGFIVSLMIASRALRKLEVHRLLSDHGVAGEMMMLRYELTNHSRLPLFGLVLMETWGRGRRGWRKAGPIAEEPPMLRGRPHGWLLHLGPKQTLQAEAPCWPVRRGKLRFERIVISMAFPFGIVREVPRN